MRVEDFVSALRAKHVDELVQAYAEAFSKVSLNGVKDSEMKELSVFWRAADEPTRLVLTKFMRLGSQNTLASLLAVLDNTSSEFAETFSLVAHSRTGEVSNLSADLLDTFWAQEEEQGHVNQRAT